MATPAIGDDIIDPSKVMDHAAAARARSFTTPTARPVQHADETGSDFGSNIAGFMQWPTPSSSDTAVRTPAT